MGATTHVKEVVENLKKLGNEITLVSPPFSKTKINVKTIKLNVPNIGGFKKIFFQLKLLTKFFGIIKKQNPDVILVRHSPLNIGFLLPTILTKKPFFEETLQNILFRYKIVSFRINYLP